MGVGRWVRLGALAAAVLCGPLGASSVPQESQAGSAVVEVLLPGSARSIASDTVVLFIRNGQIDDTTAARVAEAVERLPASTVTLILRLDLRGGGQRATGEIVSTLGRLADRGIRLRTLVHQGDVCASACILLFMQGQERYAGNASAWGFHGACYPGTNVPSPGATRQQIEDLITSGVSRAFLDRLRSAGCMDEPGVYWLSGYELKSVYGSGIVTHLAPAWQPEYPSVPMPDPGLGPR